jgi:hypothetical protein
MPVADADRARHGRLPGRPSLGPLNLGLFWASIAGVYSLLPLSSGLNVQFSLADVVSAVVFWGALGAAAGVVARRRLPAWIDAHAELGWALAAAVWASVEAVFTILVVIKPTRWPPLPFALVGLGLPAVAVATVSLRALVRAWRGAPSRVSPAPTIVASWTLLAALLLWLPRWLRIFSDSLDPGWLVWGLLDLVWITIAAGAVVTVGAALLAPGHRRMKLLGVAGIILLLQLLPLAIHAPAARVPSRGPSVVWIMIDGMRVDHSSAYGYPRPTTPNLERLAAEGSLVHGHISSGTRTENTYAKMLALAPSLAGFDGAPPAPLSSVRRLLPAAAQIGLVALLHELGYETALFHVYHDLLEDRGLQPWLQPLDHAHATRLSGDTSAGPYFVRLLLGQRLDGKPRMDRWAAHRRRYLAEVMPGEVDAFLEARRDQGPLFLIIHLAGAHAPHYTFEASHRLPDPPAGVAGRYDDALRAGDDQLGALVRTIDARLPGAVLFVFSDHGDKLKGEPLLPQHVNVPLVVRPSLSPKPPTGTATSSLDLVATTLALASGSPARCDTPLARDLRCPAVPGEVRVVDHTGHGELVLAAAIDGELFAVDIRDDGIAIGGLTGTALSPCEFLARARISPADLETSPIETRAGLVDRLRQQLVQCGSAGTR